MQWHNQWASVSEFINMGGYAFFVWASFGACAVACLVELLQLRRRRQAAARRVLGSLRDGDTRNGDAHGGDNARGAA
jgi:heme exporter protein D